MNITVNAIDYRLSIHNSSQSTVVYAYDGSGLVASATLNHDYENGFAEFADGEETNVSYYEFANEENPGEALGTWLVGTL
jgi:hypothetical protein